MDDRPPADAPLPGTAGRYLIGEITPRAGYAPGKNQATFGIEKRAAGHMFQLNVSNGFATMPASLSRGAFSNDNWYLGFNLGRKFYGATLA